MLCPANILGVFSAIRLALTGAFFLVTGQGVRPGEFEFDLAGAPCSGL